MTADPVVVHSWQELNALVERVRFPQMRKDVLPTNYSSWSNAGPLLEEMRPVIPVLGREAGTITIRFPVTLPTTVTAPTTPCAIVLVYLRWRGVDVTLAEDFA